ncbi:hypothetical protein POV90_21690 [Enterobacter roggenkampii]|uniref:hypothetical protein n=1 Tax=Enterobacter roggenkampii TaxID=1812935 RepID=UPI002FF5ADF0
MSNIDKRAQKELYATVEKQAHKLRGNPIAYQVVTGMCPVNVIEMQAQKVQTLLDELEAKDKLNAEQADIIAKQEKWIKDVEATMITATDRAEAAEKRIAELEERTLVPVEPTLDQLVAGKRRLTSTGRMSRLMSQRLAEVYRAMVNAAATGKGEA